MRRDASRGMALTYGLIWGAVVIFGATAVGALVWAISHGQMGDPAQGARSIFDAGEPVGEATDALIQGQAKGGEMETRGEKS